MSFKLRKYACALAFSAVFLILTAPAVLGSGYQISGAIDIRSEFSDGEYSVNGLANLARQRGLDVLIINDHDLLRIEYGLPPFRDTLKKTVEHNSILKMGADRYLQAIRDAEKKSGVIVIPGTESAPFYYWSGNPLTGSLTAHDHEKRLLTIGLETADAYRNLPLLHNRIVPGLIDLLPGSLIIFAAMVIGAVMLRWQGLFRVAGILAILFGGLTLYDGFLRNTTPFDAYHGNRGMAPYQYFIDYVEAHGGLTFWNYPETRSGVRKMGPIQVHTRPYPNVLIDSKDYTGFAALYGDTITLTEPGGLWDMALKEYCKGLRTRPPWGIATGDFHKESRDSRLGDFQTVFLVREKTKKEILSAMKKGHMYSAQGRFPRIPRLGEFTVTGDQPESKAVCGDSLVVNGNPKVRIVISGNELQNKRAVIRLIRNGEVIKTFDGDLPALIEIEDNGLKPGEAAYYRMDMKGEGFLSANPIFVQKKAGPPPPKT